MVDIVVLIIFLTRMHLFDIYYPKIYCKDNHVKNNSIINPHCEKQDQTITYCPVDVTINMIGGKYKSLILWKLMSKSAMRFSELHKEIPTATAKMLTQQLRELESNGLIHRQVFPVVPPKVEYSLTNFGKSIKPVLESMYLWGSDYLNNQGLQVNCSMTALDQ